MSAGPAVLAVTRDPKLIEHLRVALQSAPECHLHVGNDAAPALERARAHLPVLVFVDVEVREACAATFVPKLRAELKRPALILAIAGPSGTLLAPAGVEGLLVRPPDAAHIVAQLRLAERLVRNEAELAQSWENSDRLEQESRALEEQFHSLLHTLVGLGVPGGMDRSKQIADLARRMAERYHVPDPLIPDLVTAARLHELGHLAATNPTGPVAVAHAWEYTQRTHALLEQVRAFQGAADLVAEIYENWDGTGHPRHLLQGQIPLRCRILRVLIDYFAILRRPEKPSTQEALDELARHGGTLYDPLVVIHLRSLLGSASDPEWHASNRVVPIEELEVGMVLSEDLYSTNGVKLLSRGTSLSSESLEIILTRHRAQPILQGASVVRASA